MQISNHITYEEATQSNTATRKGIDNIPSGEDVERMKIVAEKCFEPARAHWGKPLIVSSFFRSSELNKAVGGSMTSQHVKGEAIDLSTGTKDGNKKLIEWMKENLIYDQLIEEYGYSWIHVSFTTKGNRNQYLVVK